MDTTTANQPTCQTCFLIALDADQISQVQQIEVPANCEQCLEDGITTYGKWSVTYH